MPVSSSAPSPDAFAALPPPERQVIELALAGLPNKVIAGRLGVSLRTVERRRAAALRRLGAGTLVEAARLRSAPEAARHIPGGFEAVFAGAAAPISIADRSGRFVAVNAGFCELVEATESELLSRRFPDVIHPDDRLEDVERARRLFAGEIVGYRAKKRLLTGSGRVVRVELAVAPVWSQDGTPEFTLGQVLAVEHAA